LKPQKYAFSITSRKLLGFMILKRGTKVDPKKVKSIINIAPTKNIKQIRSLQGKINFVRRFIFHVVDKCMSFTHLIKKDIKFIWDDNYQ